MQYLIALLVLATALEYARRERSHRRLLASLRLGLVPRAIPAGRSIAAGTAAALTVLVVSILLLVGALPAGSTDWLTRALGAALMPVAAMLGVMTFRMPRAEAEP